MTAEHSLTLTEGLRAPSHARAWLSARVPNLPPTVCEDALLITSELVTNAVQHGTPDVVLRLIVDDARLRIEVSDGNATMPTVPAAEPAIDRPTGRGLLIVAATASDWGVERTGDRVGKVVWAEIRIGSMR